MTGVQMAVAPIRCRDRPNLQHYAGCGGKERAVVVATSEDAVRIRRSRSSGMARTR